MLVSLIMNFSVLMSIPTSPGVLLGSKVFIQSLERNDHSIIFFTLKSRSNHISFNIKIFLWYHFKKRSFLKL